MILIDADRRVRSENHRPATMAAGVGKNARDLGRAIEGYYATRFLSVNRIHTTEVSTDSDAQR